VHRIELLAKSHDRDGFDCGSEPLNLYLKQTARQHAERGISRTFVLVDEDAPEPKPIVGFFTLNLCQVKSESLTAAEAKKLPRDVAGVRLGRLARAKEYKGQGIGEVLLVAAMKKFVEIFNVAGGIGLFVDAKDQKAKEFYERYGFVSMPSSELQLFLPVRTIQEALASH
jgi:ribosomal protein S18 acetylase RimI-like enzyme